LLITFVVDHGQLVEITILLELPQQEVG